MLFFVIIHVLTLESTLLRSSVVSFSLPQHLGQTVWISGAQKKLNCAHGFPSVSWPAAFPVVFCDAGFSAVMFSRLPPEPAS